MVMVERTFTVERPLAEVICYLEDFAKTEEWDPGTVRCTRLDSGPVREGAQWHNISEFWGRRTELVYSLVTREEGRLTFAGSNKTVHTVDDMSFEPAGVDTVVTYRATIRFRGLAKVVGPFARREFERLGDEVAQRVPRVFAAKD